jgi:hypothetical protein
MSTVGYKYTENGHVFTFTRNGVLKTHTFSHDNNVSVLSSTIDAFSAEELNDMGISQKFIDDDWHNCISAELSGGIHTSYTFYYINCQPDTGPVTQFWIESATEGEQLRNEMKKQHDDYINAHEEADRNKTCSFCGDKEIDCGGDHSSEMREIWRNSRVWD